MSEKDWPSDAVMVIAANFGEENRKGMEAVMIVYCRDCKAKLAADAFSIRRAEQLAGDLRPVKFLCIECSLGYDLGMAQVVEDHRDAATRAAIREL